MDIDSNVQRKELEDYIHKLLQELAEIDELRDKGLVDIRSYENHVLFLKKQLTKTQRELDMLD